MAAMGDRLTAEDFVREALDVLGEYGSDGLTIAVLCERLIKLSKAERDPMQRMRLLIDIGVDLPHASEAAIRAWGRSNPEVAAVTARVDKRRERHVADAVVALGIDRPRARLLARMSIDLLVGMQQRETQVDRRRARQMFEELERLTFLEADPVLLARIVARTGR